MANNYEQIMALVNAGNKMGLSNAITRDNGIPLDLSSVYNTYEDAVVYAATKAIAYQNQVIAAEGIVYVIVAEPQGKVKIGEVEYDNYLKPVGTAPSGDDASISVTAEGLVSVFGFATAQDGMLPVREDGVLTWKTLEAIGAGDGNDNTTYTFALNNDKNGIVVTPLFNGQPIYDGEGEDAPQIKYEVVLDVYTKGEADEKFLAKADYTPYDDTALANRVKALEDEERYDETPLANRVTALEEEVNGKPESEEGAEDGVKGLRTLITEEVARATAKESELADAIAAIDFVDEDELATAIQGAKDYTDEEIGKVNEAISNLNHFTAKVVTDKAEMTETGVLYLFKIDSATGADIYEEYIVVDGVATLIGDTTTDLSNYYNKTEIDGKVEILEGAIADAQQAAIDDADGKLANKLDTSVFTQFQADNTDAIATAKQEAIDAAAEAEEAKGYAVASEVDATYATKQSVTDLGTSVDTKLADYAKTEDVQTELDKKVDAATIAHTSEDVAEGATVDGTTLNIVVDAYKKSETYTKDEVNTAITNKIGEMTGGESAADVLAALNDYKKANDAEVYGSDKVASWTDAEGKYTPVYTQDSRIDTLAKDVVTAQTQADKGVADAKTANDAITALTNGAVATNTSDIGAIKTRLNTLETAKGDHETRISSAEGKITALESANTTINNTIGTIEGNITALQSKDAEIAGQITALQSNKADASAVYTKGETDTAISDAIAAIEPVDLTPYLKSEDAAKTYATIAGLEAIYKAGEGEAAATGILADEIARATAAEKKIADDLALLIENPTEALDSVKELIAHVQENGTAVEGIITRLDGHDAVLAGITTTVTAYVADAIAAVVQPKASTEVTVAEDGTLGIGQVSTDKLVQGTETLVLDGGSSVQ